MEARIAGEVGFGTVKKRNTGLDPGQVVCMMADSERMLASDVASFSLWCRQLLSFAETKEKVVGGSGRRTEELCRVCSGEGERELPGDSLRAAEVTSRELRAAPNVLSRRERRTHPPS